MPPGYVLYLNKSLYGTVDAGALLYFIDMEVFKFISTTTWCHALETFGMVKKIVF